jgi:hypothetical protein
MADTISILQQSVWTQMQTQFTMYQTGAVLLFFVIIGFIILFREAFPFVWARFVTHNVVVGLKDKNNVISINGHFSKKDGKYYYRKQPLDFVKVYPGNFFFAGHHYDVLDVELDVINSPGYKKACDKLKASGYKDMDALERAILFSQMNKDDERIKEMITREGFKNYEDASKKINPLGLGIHSDIMPMFFIAAPLSSLVGYGSEVPPEDIAGEVDDTYEANKPSKAAMKKIMAILPYAVGMIAFAIIIALVYKMFIAA